MKNSKTRQIYLLLVAILGVSALIGCSIPGGGGGGGGADTTKPTVASTSPADSATGVAIMSVITATFSEAMDPLTIVGANFTVAHGVTAVPGAVTYDVAAMKATFTPTNNLSGGSTVYTVTVKDAVKDLAGNGLAADKVWSFTTTSVGLGPSPVVLGTAGNFVILAKAMIANVPTSVITGNVGISPAAETFMTGFSQTDAGDVATSPQVTGFLYAADMAPPTPANMTTAIADMETAYTDAAGRTTPDHLNLSAGALGGLTLSPGLYKWTTAVSMATDVTISGGPADIWIFQVAGAITEAASVQVILLGGAQAKNIFWQATGAVGLGAGAHMEGIVLGQTSITMGAGASLTGRAYAQTAVTMSSNTVTQPAP